MPSVGAPRGRGGRDPRRGLRSGSRDEHGATGARQGGERRGDRDQRRWTIARRAVPQHVGGDAQPGDARAERHRARDLDQASRRVAPRPSAARALITPTFAARLMTVVTKRKPAGAGPKEPVTSKTPEALLPPSVPLRAGLWAASRSLRVLGPARYW